MAQVRVILRFICSRTPSAKAIVSATSTAKVTQDARLTLKNMTSQSAPILSWVHLNAVRSPLESCLCSTQPATTMKLRTQWVQTVALPMTSALVLANAPPGCGARAILAATRPRYLRRNNAKSTSQRMPEDPTGARAATNAPVSVLAPTTDGARAIPSAPPRTTAMLV